MHYSPFVLSLSKHLFELNQSPSKQALRQAQGERQFIEAHLNAVLPVILYGNLSRLTAFTHGHATRFEQAARVVHHLGVAANHHAAAF